MPKDKRGGRSLRKNPYNEYETIDTANNGRIKVIKARDDVENAGIPMFSNRRNTVYMVANGDNKIESIAIYKNRKLEINVDIDPEKGDHFHKWREKPEAKKKGKNKGKFQIEKYGHYYKLKPAYLKLIQIAQNWNNGGR